MTEGNSSNRVALAAVDPRDGRHGRVLPALVDQFLDLATETTTATTVEEVRVSAVGGFCCRPGLLAPNPSPLLAAAVMQTSNNIMAAYTALLLGCLVRDTAVGLIDKGAGLDFY